MVNVKALKAKLDARQQKAAFLLVEREMAATAERRTIESIAEEIGVNPKTIYDWKRNNSHFISYKNAIADEFLSENRAHVYSQLMKLIGGEQPSVKAIDLFMRRFGLLTEKQVIETVDSGASKTNSDLAAEMKDIDRLLEGDD